MSKYSSIKKVIINDNEFYLHKNMLSKLPFFEDFVKSNDDEIKIEYTDDIDTNTIELFIDNLYNVPIAKIGYLELYKLFKFADFLCVNLVCFHKKDIPNNDLLKYVYERNEIDAFLKFQKWLNIEFGIKDLLNNGANDDFIMQIKTSFTIMDLNDLLDNKKYDLIIKFFKNKSIVYPPDYSSPTFYFYCNINSILDFSEDIESKKEIMEYVLADNIIMFKMSLYSGISKDNLVEYYREKLKNII